MLRILFALVILICSCIKSSPQDSAEIIDRLISLYEKNDEFSGSVLVVDNNQVILSRGYGLAMQEWNIPNTPETRFRIASITKQFTSCLIFKFIEMGKLSLDNCISDFIPFYPEESGCKILLRHLLTHTSGLPNYTGMTITNDYYNRDEFIRQFCAGELRFEPGKRYSYSNTGYYLLGDILERVSGMSFEHLLEKYIFQPAGMNSSGADNGYKVIPHMAFSYESGLDGYLNANSKDSQDMSSIVFSAGYIYSTVQDMYRFYSALGNGDILGEKEKTTMLSVVAPLTSPEKMAKQNPLLYEVLGGSNLGFFGDVFIKSDSVNGRSIYCYQHNGGINMYRSHSYYIPSLGRCIIVLGNNGSEVGDNIVWQAMRILDGRKFDEPLISLVTEMRRTYSTGGIVLAISLYNDKRNNKKYYISERGLNAFGYSLVHLGRLNEAAEVFRTLVKDYPGSYNAWDSYAENCLARGDTLQAIKHYQHSLELNPESRSGKEALKKLGQQ